METGNQIRLREERDFGQIINATFSFWKQNLKPLTKSIITIVGPALLIGLLLVVYIFSQMMSADFAKNPQAASGGFDGIALAYLVYIISFILLTCVVYNYIALYLQHNQEEISVQMVWNEVRRSFWKILLLGVLVGISVGIGFIFLILPGVYLGVAFSLAFIALVVEKTNVIDALSRSFKLIRGNWWSMFGLTIVIAIIVTVINYSLLLPYYFIMGVIGMNFSEDPQLLFDPSSPLVIVSAIFLPLFFVASLILYAIPMIATSFKYFSIVEERESVGMMEEVENLDNGPAGQ